MTEHPNVAVVNRMTRAAMDGDREALASCFTEDMAFHVRGPLPGAGDHRGAQGFLGVIGSIFEVTNGDVEIEQLFAAGDDGWVAEWERAVFGRDGETLEAKNAFIYRFEDDRIAEMWMLCSAPAGSEAFFA